MKKYQASLCNYPDVWNDALKHKFLKQELDFKTTYQARASTKDVTVYCQVKDSVCSPGLLMVRTVTKWLVVLCTESLIQSPLETVENKLLAFIKRYWFVVHRMNIFECLWMCRSSWDLFFFVAEMLQRSESVSVNLFAIWNCYTPLFLPYIFTECANFRTGTFCASVLLRALSSSVVQRLVVLFLLIRTVVQITFYLVFR